MRKILIYITTCLLIIFSTALLANSEAAPAAANRGVQPVVQFDISPPLRDIPPKPLTRQQNRGGLIVDPPGIAIQKSENGPQTPDAAAQIRLGSGSIPGPTVSFDGPNNISGLSPPDPIGDVGPNHYVIMSNLFFQIFDKSGVSLMPPTANNTLWSGFGGACETENAGDPVVLHDQIDDRWFLSQFTSAGPQFFFCVAISTSPDPLGTYARYAISTGTNFPDYPKAGVWSDGFYISTREFAGGAFAGIGVYALERSGAVAGDPNATVISMLLTPAAVGAQNTGDGLLPADLDGFNLPPNGSPAYYLGTMDDGGPYGATQDALSFWRFVADFDNPPASSFTLTDTIPIADFDTIFPCPGGGRSCIPQPNTANMIDILSYRQRPIHRFAYRNLGSHEALVTSQSVEGPNQIAGTRWWELRLPGGNPVIHQEGTYSPGATDGIHRWMGSAAMDSAGNIALGYSASDGVSVFPSLRYSGRLSTDPLGTFPQGEGSIVEGTGSQTNSQRWGDYSSLNIDPVDDCTFWYTNEYYATDGGNWQLRIGAFRFNECGTPGFSLAAQNASQSICAGDPAVYDLNLGSISNFDQPVTLTAQGVPAPATANFSPNPVSSLPGSSQLTINNTAGLGNGDFLFQVQGSASGADNRVIDLGLNSFAAIPETPTLNLPANGQNNVEFRPALSWAGLNTENYTIEVATDTNFNDIVFTSTLTATTVSIGFDLDSNTRYFWRVRSSNTCGLSVDSRTFSFTTMPAPGDCEAGVVPNQLFFDDMEGGDNGWTHSGTQDTWQRSGLETSSGDFAWFAENLASTSDQLLVSPAITLPTGQLPMVLSFQNSQTIENDVVNSACWDAGLLEISIDDGATWTQITPAELLTDPYDGTVNDFMADPNPLAGLEAWCADPEDFVRSIVNLSAYQGETVRFRFRLGTDGTVGRANDGWFIDDVSVQSCTMNEEFHIDGFEDIM